MTLFTFAVRLFRDSTDFTRGDLFHEELDFLLFLRRGRKYFFAFSEGIVILHLLLHNLTQFFGLFLI